MRARFTGLMSLATWCLCLLPILGAVMFPQLSSPLLIASAVLLVTLYERSLNKKMGQLSPNPRRRRK